MTETGTFGEAICRLRTALGLSQVELADALGVSQSTVSAWETDATRPRWPAMGRLAEVLKVDASRLAELLVQAGTGGVRDSASPSAADAEARAASG